jgi:hypothetical protein
MQIRTLLFSALFFFGLASVQAQANLSVQGTIQESTGAAVENGDYSLTFKLYTTETGGTPVWSETQSQVNIVGGVYSVVLGTVTPLTAAFDQTYYLGLTVGSGAELTPRTRLTSSPYALSLIGQDNKFPSTGPVGVGTASPKTGNELHVKDAAAAAQVLVEGATTSKILMESTDGTEIEFKKGANTASITYDGNNINIENLNLVYSSGITLPQGQSISYDGLKDWRLVEVDDFESGIEGWKAYSGLNATSAYNTDPILLTFSGANKTQKGNALSIPNATGNMVLKKLIDLTGIPHTQVKIKCTIYPTGTPDNEWIFAAVAPAMNTINAYEFVWQRQYAWSDSFHGISVFNINMGSGRPAGTSETGEFIIPTDQNSFVFLVGCQMDGAASDEGFMIDNVEIWVK